MDDNTTKTASTGQNDEQEQQRHNDAVLLAITIPIGAVLLVFGGFVIQRQAAAYTAQGVPSATAYGGAITAQLAVLALCVAAKILHARVATDAYIVVGIIGAVAALAFAILPTATQGAGWVTVVLSTVLTLVFDAVALGGLWLFWILGRPVLTDSADDSATPSH